MRKSLLPLLLPCLLATTVALGACSPQPPEKKEPAPAAEGAGDPAASAATDTGADSADADNATAAAEQGLPATEGAQVNEWTSCPYLDSQWVADTNGQRLTTQGIDTRFDPPACAFWSYPDAPQVTVIVRHMPSVEEARAVVDWAAPIDSTEPADFEGWTGGRGVFSDSSVYAVQKNDYAVAVWTNQQQTLKAELIAKEAISNLKL
ncbi:DUF2020 domain-containing protein [Corynebacterium flavescens]|uniref:DUF2020 domain-containing protein n=1 Tax=Corynebacterium flavescens TaxID=28028 RepID=UPI003FCF685D